MLIKISWPRERASRDRSRGCNNPIALSLSPTDTFIDIARLACLDSVWLVVALNSLA